MSVKEGNYVTHTCVSSVTFDIFTDIAPSVALTSLKQNAILVVASESRFGRASKWIQLADCYTHLSQLPRTRKWLAYYLYLETLLYSIHFRITLCLVMQSLRSLTPYLKYVIGNQSSDSFILLFLSEFGRKVKISTKLEQIYQHLTILDLLD